MIDPRLLPPGDGLLYTPSPSPSPGPSNAHQEHFEQYTANIRTFCGLLFNLVENQAVRNFLDNFLPLAAHVTPMSLAISSPTVLCEVNQYKQAAKSASKGCQATLQTDGWTGINFHHLIAIMVTIVRCKVHTVQVVDVSSERRTAGHLKELVKDVARDDYYAHQQITELITWLQSKIQVLAMLRDIQKGINLINPSASHKILSRGRGNKPCIVVDNATSQRKAAAMLKLIENPLFWHTLARILLHIQPLALAVNCTQAAHCQLDEVLIMFGFLTLTYTEMLKDASEEDEIMITRIMNSLKKCWSKSEQEVFIAAVILNPVIYLLVVKLWKCFYSTDPSIELQQEMMDYLQGLGDYKGMDAWVQATIQVSIMNHQRPDHIQMYESISFSDQEPTSLKKLGCKFGLLKSLLNITELALHIRDEYSQSEKVAESSEIEGQEDITPDLSISSADFGSFAEMIDVLGKRSDADDEGDVDFTSPFERKSLVSLFNFQDKSWAEITEKLSLRSLDEELELYELIDLDAEGENDEQEFDNMMSSTM
ncbi:hypothetical protein V8B97DRAFT_2026853 [Scleroderma yunnanense]